MVYHLCSGACRVAESNGAILCLKLVTFSLVPYYRRNHKVIPVTQIIDSGDLENLSEHDDEGVADDDEDFYEGGTTGETKRDQLNMHIDSCHCA